MEDSFNIKANNILYIDNSSLKQFAYFNVWYPQQILQRHWLCQPPDPDERQDAGQHWHERGRDGHHHDHCHASLHCDHPPHQTGLLLCFVQKFYVNTASQVNRLESITRSPIYTHFSASITGAQLSLHTSSKIMDPSRKNVRFLNPWGNKGYLPADSPKVSKKCSS